MANLLNNGRAEEESELGNRGVDEFFMPELPKVLGSCQGKPKSGYLRNDQFKQNDAWCVKRLIGSLLMMRSLNPHPSICQLDPVPGTVWGDSFDTDLR